MWAEILAALKTIIANIEQQAGTALSFMLSFFKEAITEEEAALFPAFQALATKILNDEAAIQGIDVKGRVALMVSDFLATLPADIALAKNALVNSWAWAVAHQQGLTDGNQGVLPGGTETVTP